MNEVIWANVMNQELLETLKQISRMVAADSDLDEDNVLKDLVIKVQPYIEISMHATGEDKTAIRAIKYIGFTHAFPRCGATVENYIAMLEALMEVVFPMAIQNDQASEFLDDLQEGIRRARNAATKFSKL